MKNIIPSSILLLALAAGGHAQSGLIIRGGFNLSNAVIDPEPPDFLGQKGRPGFNAALLGDISLGGPLYLLVGGGYETRGVEGEFDDNEGAIRLNYLTVPVMVSLRAPFAPGGPRLFLNLGTEPAFLVSADNKLNDVAWEADNFEGFDLGLRGEVGVEIPAIPNGPSVLVGAGYSYGLTDANANDDEWHNHALHLFLGLRFAI